MFSLKNKTTIMTGGGSGIGRATSLLFGKQGATVWLVDINQDQVEETIRLIKDEGGKAYGYTCDVTVQADVISLYNEIGTINVLINSAGVSHIGKADTTTEAEFDRVFKGNVKGVYNSLHASLGIMKQHIQRLNQHLAEPWFFLHNQLFSFLLFMRYNYSAYFKMSIDDYAVNKTCSRTEYVHHQQVNYNSVRHFSKTVDARITHN